MAENGGISQLIAEAQQVGEDARRIFGGLTPAQINWKPSPEQWSVAQCFDHLIKINSAFFPQLLRIEAGQYSRTWRDRVPFLGRAVGRMILRAVQPEARRKFKAAASVSPAASAIDDVLPRFSAHQDEVIEHMRRLAGRDAESIVVTSPVAPVFYSLLDGLRILVAHERRHVAQALRVTQTPEFPRSNGVPHRLRV